jgi:predicted glycosyltransferase
MRYLFDLQHPAHLHFFRPVIARLEAEGHQVRVTGRDKDILVNLADGYGIDITVFGTARKGVFNLGKEWIYRQWLLNKIIREFQPDVMMAVAGTFISLLGKLRRIPTYIFYDTEHATISNLLAYPFATCIYVPQCYRKKIRWKHARYNGYHEIAYLHPNYFQPDDSVLAEVGLEPGEIFTLVRFVGWGAGHDIGRSGLTTANKIRTIKELSAYGQVFISSEGSLPPELESHRLRLEVTKIHSLMAYAGLIFGESATMASEGAVLGVPGIYVDPVGRGYTDEQEREYGIVFNFTHRQQDEAIKKAVSILSAYQTKKREQRERWQNIGKKIINDKIDVTQMIHQLAVKVVSSK